MGSVRLLAPVMFAPFLLGAAGASAEPDYAADARSI
jgi:hypothetical protein